MAKRDVVKEDLERLRSLAAEDPRGPDTMAALRKGLRGRAALVAGRAARIAERHGLAELRPDLTAAFEGFLLDPRRPDRGCNAKVPIAQALDVLEHDDPTPFLAGVRHVQLEAGPGGQVDAAAPLRGRCVAALVRLRHPEAHRELARVLFDSWPEARFGAVRAAGFDGGPEADLLLRARVYAGDREPRILGACLTGLLAISPDSSLDVANELLHSSDQEVREQSALALAESRHPEALECLKEAWRFRPDETSRRGLLLPISLLRTDEACAFLVEVLEECSPRLAREAIHALSVGPEHRRLLAAARAALASRGDRELLRAFDRDVAHLGSPEAIG